MNALQKLEMQNYIILKLPIEMPREELAAAQENALLDAEGDVRDFEVDGFDFT
jgi:hypothetical protein